MALDLLCVIRMGWVATIVVSMVGCVLPPTLENGPQVNQPPRIQPETLSPAPTKGVKDLSLDCKKYCFFAGVTDPDDYDTIYWRTFIDYNLDDSPWLAQGGSVAPDPTRPGKPVLVKFEISPTDERFGDRERSLSEPHVVELLVSDREFFEDNRVPEGRAVQEDGLLDTFVWAVQVIVEPDDTCLGGC